MPTINHRSTRIPVDDGCLVTVDYFVKRSGEIGKIIVGGYGPLSGTTYEGDETFIGDRDDITTQRAEFLLGRKMQELDTSLVDYLRNL